ncbi:Aminotransferase, class V/Cysteine desulfurase [Kalmanozyma brasiliensis GHG001]|uniref:Kynureninase n=1 Tax=Kalmanozyma brasiliensis (strain GHG001) TaxID=1365824 RepID=V5EE09_KALBG|nr:Aminotransferase, class V/Cysteine desulfurase [Kalmanozyma brasiliensis GHG001]EST08706.1 Aminotransferase, class V/Cysteine desulfurase [Kalmanozyma brasiliensis GHG001]
MTTDQAAEKELQSSLLRISIICASSIQSLREPVQPTILPADDDQASSSSVPPTADKLSTQIVSDLTQLLTLVQKHSNNLAVALKPSAKASSAAKATANGSSNDVVSPVSGLDAKSLEAAQAQIVSLGSDLLPKIVFLAKKAWKDREVFQKRPQANQNDPAQIEERRKLEKLAKEMGGQIMSADQLGLPPSERDDLEKKLEYSLGNSFAREVRSAVEDVIGSIADLFHSLLDDRAKKALENASQARDRADGVIAGVSKKLESLSVNGNDSPAELRKRTLAANNLVWETCAKYIGERNADGTPRTLTSIAPNGVRTKVHVKGLSRSNLEACKRSWSNRVELMRDGLQELKEGIEADQSQTGAAVDAGEADEFSFPDATPLSPEQKDRLRQLSNLVKMGNLTHENILKEIAKSDPAKSGIDLDEVEELGKQLEEAQDELVAACLYGEADAGLEVKMFDHDAEEDEDTDANEAAGDDADADLTEEQAIEKAVLRTFEQYVQAVVTLSAYVTDRDELVEQINIASATDEEGAFANVFAAKFNQLSKVLSEASSGIAVRGAASSSSANGAQSAPSVQHKSVVQANEDFKTEVFVQELQSIADKLGSNAKVTDRAIAEQLDKADPLRQMRAGYILPTFKDVCSSDYPSTSAETAPDAESLYMCGNSLGPLSRLGKQYLEQEIEAWGRKAVLGHFEHPYGTPWTQMEGRVGELCANMVGAKKSEVVVMGTLTGNLHSLMATFYRPATKPFGIDFTGDVEAGKKDGRKTKHKIIFEQKAFPSDQYALASVIELNGFDPKTSMVPLVPKEGSKTLETADILATIEKCGKEGETAMVLIGGIQYFTGQLFELEKLAAKAHEYDILFGVDLAHAFANVPLALHDWGIDFACWCTYKYGSSGPGGIAGLFVHDKWHHANLTRQAGWWGHEKETRFSMPDQFVPTRGAEGWQTSNPSMLDMASLKGSLETLLKATEFGERNARDEGLTGEGKHGKGTIMPILRSKSLRLTAYLETLLLSPGFFPDGFDIRIVTPRDPLQRGSQLCIQIPDPPATEKPKEEQKQEQQQASGKDVPPPIDGKRLIARAHKRAEKQRGLVADIRHPDMLRLAPLAQFSTYTDVWRTADVLRQSLLDEVEANKAS